MASFSRTTRALESERRARWATPLVCATAILGAWTAWMLLGRVGVHAVSVDARLMVEGESHPVAADVGGRVIRTSLEIGREVQAGQVLVELDSAVEHLALEEERAKRAALQPQIEALRAELEAESQALGELRGSRRAVAAEAQALLRQAEAAARMAAENATRNERMRGNMAEVELLRARSLAEERSAAAEAQAQAASRRSWEQRQAESTRRAQLERLRRELLALQGELTSAAVAIERLEQDIERRQIRAPIAGRLGEIGTLRVGSVIRGGERVAMVVPPGEVKVTAQFAPADALGRIRPGQRARVRLDGFPWSQYGSLTALVARVAGEVRDSSVRVELVLRPDRSSRRIPLTHALPGVVEVQIERVSPAVLLLRAAGRLLDGGFETEEAEELPVAEVRLGEHTVLAEVAADPASRARGLMFRTHVAEGTGMLFVYPSDTRLSFWMKNTLVPLSIAYIDGGGRIVQIEDMHPGDESAHPSNEAVRYALEVPQGWFAARGIGPGDSVDLSIFRAARPR